MKKLALLGFIFACFQANAQSLEDYQYVIVPQKFSDFDQDEFQLNKRLTYYLNKKNYTILSDDQKTWPAEVLSNPCSAAISDVKKVRNLLKVKLEINFSDCSRKNIAAIEGVSSIKEYDKGYQEAMKLATDKIKNSNPKATSQTNLQDAPKVVVYSEEPKQNISTETKVNKNTESISNVTLSVVNNKYISDGKEFTLETMKDDALYLIQSDNSQIVAKLYPSHKNGIFHTTVTDGNYQTIAYFENNQLIIEYKNSSNSWSVKKYNQAK